MNGIPGRVGIVLGSSVAAALFAWLNVSERVTLHFGIASVRSIPVSIVVFGSILFGMALLFLVGLRADLKTRRMLRRYRETLGQGGAPDGPGDRPDES